jgi:hypothetical protein
MTAWTQTSRCESCRRINNDECSFCRERKGLSGCPLHFFVFAGHDRVEASSRKIHPFVADAAIAITSTQHCIEDETSELAAHHAHQKINKHVFKRERKTCRSGMFYITFFAEIINVKRQPRCYDLILKSQTSHFLVKKLWIRANFKLSTRFSLNRYRI